MARIMAALVFMAGVAAAQDEGKKKAGGPLGLPLAADLKEKCGLDDEQIKKVEEIYTSYKEKAAEAQKKVREAQEADKRAAAKEAGTLRGEIAGKICEIGKDDEQKKKLTEATAKAPPKKKDAK